MANDGQKRIELARSLLRKGGALQSTQGGEQIDPAKLRAELERALVLAEPDVSAVEAKMAAAAILSNAERALNSTTAANLTDLEASGLEAIIHITGRPAMRYRNGAVEMPPTEIADNQHWGTFVATCRSSINEASEKVGMVSTDAGGVLSHHGTVWVLRDDLVVTNRHVARVIAETSVTAASTWTLDPNRTVLVDFAVTDGTPVTHSFPVTAIAWCDDDPEIDLAVLRLDRQGKTLPGPLTLNWQSGAAAPGREVYVVGHPEQIGTSAIQTVFGQADGRKRCAPGLVTQWSVTHPRGFEHDCSTLHGNSGSCVLTTAGHEVVGLHYGGLKVQATAMGTANIALALSKLTDTPVMAVLAPGGSHS